MNRRSFVGAIAGIPVATLAILRELDGSGHFGLMTVERHWELAKQGIYLRVFLGDRNVTDRCMCADDSEGWVVLQKRNANGLAYIDENGELAKETLYGNVSFRKAE